MKSGTYEYKVLEHQYTHELSKMVQDHLESGFVLVGGVSTTTSMGNYITYAQAVMMKHASQQENPHE